MANLQRTPTWFLVKELASREEVTVFDKTDKYTILKINETSKPKEGNK